MVRIGFLKVDIGYEIGLRIDISDFENWKEYFIGECAGKTVGDEIIGHFVEVKRKYGYWIITYPSVEFFSKNYIKKNEKRKEKIYKCV